MNKILLLLLVVLITTTAKSETKQEEAPKVVKVNIKAEANIVKGIPVDSLNSLKVKRAPKTEIKIAKNRMLPKSDSFFETTFYVVKNVFEDHPVTMTIISVIMSLGLAGIVIHFFEK